MAEKTGSQKNIKTILVSLYSYRNFPVRGLTPLIQQIDGAQAFGVFFKDQHTGKIGLPTNKEEQLFIDILKDIQPDVVGISVLSPYEVVARRISELVRENTDAMVLWGGSHGTLCPEECIKHADVLCVGEGYGAVTDLMERLIQGQPYDDIENLWVNTENGVKQNPMRPLVQDLDSLPFTSYGNPEYYFIDGDILTREDPLLSSPTIDFLTTRGCPYKCAYCINSILHAKFKGLGRFIRRRSVDSTIRELKEFLAKSNGATKNIFFIDEVFTTNKEWLRDFESRYSEEVGLPFTLELHPRLVTPELLETLTRAGLSTVVTGVQTGTDKMRNEIFGRPGTNQEIIRASHNMKKHGVHTHYDFILDNPFDTVETLRATVDFMGQLPKPLSVFIFSLQYFPKYPLTERALEQGYITPQHTTSEALLANTEKSMMYFPRVFPLTMKQILQNVIWLYTRNRVSDAAARFGALNTSAAGAICLFMLNIKAIVVGKISHAVTGNKALFSLRVKLKKLLGR